MAWQLDSDRPIYSQLMDKIKLQIISGFYKPGDKLPSVRELAGIASVNPNTMQKAFSELERSGLILTQRTSGRFVTEEVKLIDEIKENLAKQQVKAFFKQMNELGLSHEDVVNLIVTDRGE